MLSWNKGKMWYKSDKKMGVGSGFDSRCCLQEGVKVRWGAWELRYSETGNRVKICEVVTWIFLLRGGQSR